jgi:hypothetical protein
VGWGLAAGAPNLDGRLRTEKFRVLSVDEAKLELGARSNSILAQMSQPVIDTRPCVGRTGHALSE